VIASSFLPCHACLLAKSGRNSPIELGLESCSLRTDHGTIFWHGISQNILDHAGMRLESRHDEVYALV